MPKQPGQTLCWISFDFPKEVIWDTCENCSSKMLCQPYLKLLLLSMMFCSSVCGSWDTAWSRYCRSLLMLETGIPNDWTKRSSCCGSRSCRAEIHNHWVLRPLNCPQRVISITWSSWFWLDQKWHFNDRTAESLKPEVWQLPTVPSFLCISLPSYCILQLIHSLFNLIFCLTWSKPQ